MRRLLVLLLISMPLFASDTIEKRMNDVCTKDRFNNEEKLACLYGFIEGARWQLEDIERMMAEFKANKAKDETKEGQK